MKVKVGNKTYDGENKIIMVILDKDDKRNIKNMPKENTKYCAFPDGMDIKKVDKFMEII